jgi:hypothetical protein
LEGRALSRPFAPGADGADALQMSQSPAIAYWLIPTKPERELFAELIRILAQQLDAPQFEPHLTILVTAKDRPSPTIVLEQIKAKPIRPRVREIDFSSKFTKTLFVRFKLTKSLEKLVVDLARATKSHATSVRDPHLSLVYGKLPVTAKKELASTIKLPFSRVTFDSIKAVHCTLPVRGRTDVEAWRVIASKSVRR